VTVGLVAPTGTVHLPAYSTRGLYKTSGALFLALQRRISIKHTIRAGILDIFSLGYWRFLGPTPRDQSRSDFRTEKADECCESEQQNYEREYNKSASHNAEPQRPGGRRHNANHLGKKPNPWEAIDDASPEANVGTVDCFRSPLCE
jgi:hypothetical protein